MKITYTENNTHVEDSYLAKDIKFEVGCIIRERYLQFLPVTRAFESYVCEWKGHNRLYNLHLFRKHSKDVDLEESQNIFWEIVWRIIGW